jgi:hypothetical protein
VTARTRRNLSRSLLWLAIGAAALSGLTLGGWNLPVGGVAQAAGYGGQLRIEVGAVSPDPFQFRAHPASAKVRGGRSGGIVEVGIVPLAGAAAVLLTAALIVRRAPRPRRGFCPACRYNLRGLPPDAATCPECGAAIEPGFGAPPTARPVS